MVRGDFEWDSSKATSNRSKHGVTFEEATTVFADAPIDLDEGSGRARLVTIGFSHRARLLCVVHEVRDGRYRLISARVATRGESDRYAKEME